jgi:hypothetical protein
LTSNCIIIALEIAEFTQAKKKKGSSNIHRISMDKTHFAELGTQGYINIVWCKHQSLFAGDSLHEEDQLLNGRRRNHGNRSPAIGYRGMVMMTASFRNQGGNVVL